MRYFLALSAVILVASAMPTDLGKEAEALNGTFTNAGLAGFATLGGGTNGGQGGAIWTVWDAWALRDAIASNDRRIVYVRGRIDLTPLFTGTPGVRLNIGSHTSLIGGDGNAMIFGGGLRVNNAQNVIIQNIKFHNALSYASGEQPNGAGGIISMVPGAYSEIDAVEVTGSENVWIDHCEFADDPWIAATVPDSQRRHDGLIDIVRGSTFVSVSNSIFRNHNFVMLVGNGDNVFTDRGRLKVTYYLNWFMGTNQRNPRVRFGEVHVLNNLYTDITDYAIATGVEASVYVERNVFINTRRAFISAATAASPGYLLNVDNWLVNSGQDSGVPNSVLWNPSQYYGYSPMATGNVEQHVRNYAGVW